MDIRSIIKVLALFVIFHVYVFLSGLIYNVLEKKTVSYAASNVEQVLNKHFYHAATVANPLNKAAVASELKTALQKDKQNEMQRSFGSLWKAYLFSFTTIVTVGNSGLFLQNSKSQLFFIFSTFIGTVIFFALLHNIGVILLGILVKTIQYGFFLRHDNGEQGVFNPYHARISVLLLSYAITLSSIFIIPIASIISGHGYLFGLYAVTDTMLTYGNYHMLAYVHPWSEGGFVISVNIMIVLGYSFLYTTIFTTIHFVNGTKWEDFVTKYGSEERIYTQVAQEEEEPYQKFLNGTKKTKKHNNDNESIDEEIEHSVLQKSPMNPFLEEESQNEEYTDKSVVPTLLAPEMEEMGPINK